MRYESTPFSLDRGEVLRRALHPIGLRLLRGGVILSIILSGSILLLEFLTGIPLHYIEALRLPLLIFGIFGLMFAMIAFSSWRNYQSPKNAAAFGERQVSFDDEAFELRSANGAFSRVPWTAVVAAQHADRTTFLSLSLSQVFAIPDHALSPEAQAALQDRVARLPS